MIQEAVIEGINESVRIFLASKIDQYVVNEKISGVVNDFGAGVPSRFTPINAQSDKSELVIGVKQIYQGAWNPVRGLTDSYSRQIWGIISDPGSFKHPFTGETIPIRSTWDVETAGPNGKLNIPQKSVIWNPKSQEWSNMSSDSFATSKVTFDFNFSNWHNGEMMDMNDILHSLYFLIEWGTQVDENDKTFDTEFTPIATQSIQTIKGVNVIDEDTIEVYVDYWHFDDAEIADWAMMWNSMPWEVSMAMEKAVTDGKVSFSRSGATSKNVNWLSLIIPKDANIIKENLEGFKNNNYIPKGFKENIQNEKYFQDRYDSSIKWIEENNHAVISNGPFYLKSYVPESRTISVSSFNDETYPFKTGEWSKFEDVKFPLIKKIDFDKIIQREEFKIDIIVENADQILYFLTNNVGDLISSDTLEIINDKVTILIPNERTQKLSMGANNIKIFAISESVLRPDFYESSFFVTENKIESPTVNSEKAEFSKNESFYEFLIIPIIIIVGVIIVLKKKQSQ